MAVVLLLDQSPKASLAIFRLPAQYDQAVFHDDGALGVVHHFFLVANVEPAAGDQSPCVRCTALEAQRHDQLGRGRRTVGSNKASRYLDYWNFSRILPLAFLKKASKAAVAAFSPEY